MMQTVLSLLERPDPPTLEALLAPDVQFHSPFADYSGRADVAHLFATIATVLRDIETTRVLVDDRGRTTFLAATVDDHPLQAVLDERLDDDGRLVDSTLFIRPYSTLRVAMSRMGAALETSPLPSRR